MLAFHRLSAAALALAATTAAPAEDFNYAEALQKTLYFFEAQQNGVLSSNNRVAWRGASGLIDGQDIGRHLAGGLFDAGDHWTANLTMSIAAMSLAWSAVEQPEGWLKTGQMDELLETPIHVNRYFLECVLNPDCADPARDLDVAIGCGGR
jgi:endoglucanase